MTGFSAAVTNDRCLPMRVNRHSDSHWRLPALQVAHSAKAKRITMGWCERPRRPATGTWAGKDGRDKPEGSVRRCRSAAGEPTLVRLSRSATCRCAVMGGHPELISKNGSPGADMSGSRVAALMGTGDTAFPDPCRVAPPDSRMGRVLPGMRCAVAAVADRPRNGLPAMPAVVQVTTAMPAGA